MRVSGFGLFLGLLLSACSSSSRSVVGRSESPDASSDASSDAAVPWAGDYPCQSTLTTTFDASVPPLTVTEDGGLGVSVEGNTLFASSEFEYDAGAFAPDLACSQLLASITSNDVAQLLSTDPSGASPMCTFAGPATQPDAACQPVPLVIEVDYVGGTLILDGGTLTASLAYNALGKYWSMCDGGINPVAFDSGLGGSGTQVVACRRR